MCCKETTEVLTANSSTVSDHLPTLTFQASQTEPGVKLHQRWQMFSKEILFMMMILYVFFHAVFFVHIILVV